MKKLTFMGACEDFSGLREGQYGEWIFCLVRASTEGDKAEITAGLEQNGYEIQPAPGAAA